MLLGALGELHFLASAMCREAATADVKPSRSSAVPDSPTRPRQHPQKFFASFFNKKFFPFPLPYSTNILVK
jgi:hypothetical protein